MGILNKNKPRCVFITPCMKGGDSMSKYGAILLSISWIFCIAATSYALENQRTDSPDLTLRQAAEALQITGAVKSVNAEAGTVVVTKKFRDKTIEVLAVTDKGTKISRGDETKSLSDIRDGDTVAVVYTRKDSVNLAKSISLQ